MAHLLIGTAGHIDHGKTRLIEALTGIDCDRWEEEKRRGITIDLGFAHLEEGGLQLGFVDVPGHSKFLHNALAGLGGIRLVLLVVAADEGVKPQTREHLDICRLLEIPAAVVALTKCDLVDEEMRTLARGEVEELLADGPYAAASIVAVSTQTGSGLDKLRETLVAAAARLAQTAAAPPTAEAAGRPLALRRAVPAGRGRRTDNGSDLATVRLARRPAASGFDEPTRLPVDRAFQLQGRGTIITGTLTSGAIRPGDVLEVLPGGASARVRSLQVHGRDVDEALAGQRTALQLAGVSPEDVARGSQLATPGALRPTGRWVAHLSLLADAPAPVDGWTDVRVHLLTADVQARLRPLEGRLAPGESGLVELRLAAPVAAVRGDHVIVRRSSPPCTLGGGRVLDPDWRGRRGGRSAAVAKRLLVDDEAIVLWCEQAGEHGLDAADLARRQGSSPEAAARQLDALRRDQRLLSLSDHPALSAGRSTGVPGGLAQALGRRGGGRAAAPPRWIAPRTFERLSRHASRELKRYFDTHRLAVGMPKAEAIERLLTPGGRQHADIYLDWLARGGVLVVDGDRVDLPGRGDQLDEQESRLLREIEARFRRDGLAPPSPSDLRRDLQAKPQIIDGLIGYLLERGRLLRLPGGLLLSAEAVDGVRRSLREDGPDSFTVADFKQRFGLTRKWAIPLLEHLDSTGTTRRIGDRRQVVRPG